jgi:formylglycine-generating enzyme required for sulfatase activity
VRITRPFYLGRYDVTQREWQKLMGANPSKFPGEDNPVEEVSWEDAKAFLAKAGGGLTLPTEAQWEYACRAGTDTPYSFGQGVNNLNRYAWFSGDGGNHTHPVGLTAPNPWELADMHGNVRQWCADWYDSEYYKSSPTDDPQGPASGAFRVARGGSWMNLPQGCRSASRDWGAPTATLPYRGFRAAKEI